MHQYKKEIRNFKSDFEKPIWSILICSLYSRSDMFNSLYEDLKSQIKALDGKIEILALVTDEAPSIGEKRNWLLKNAIGDYICFFDDDDKPINNYVENIYSAILKSPDVVSFKGLYSRPQSKPIPWILKMGAKRNTVYNTMGVIDYYIAPPNHVAVWKKELVIDCEFPHKDFGEDSDWADLIESTNKVKTEIHLDLLLYDYVFTK